MWTPPQRRVMGRVLCRVPALTARELHWVRPYKGVLRAAGQCLPMRTVSRFRTAVPISLHLDQEAEEEEAYIPSLVDIEQLMWTRSTVLYAASRRPKAAENPAILTTAVDDDEGVCDSDHAALGVPASAAAVQGDSISSDKLQKLEDELTKLRAMIASVVIKQEGMSVQPSSASTGPPPPPPPPPPMGGPAARGGPPPPPPPPPPPGLLMEKPRESIQDIVRRNRKGQTVGSGESKPTMADVLSKLGTVKLKSVMRSPGGTPARRSDEEPPSKQSMDPVAMIALALKRKFAKQSQNSPSAATSEWEAKENEIAARRRAATKDEAPKFGTHLLRKARKPLSSAN